MGVGEADEVPADAVGRRVACGEERATVRYVGPVPPTEGRSDRRKHQKNIRDIHSPITLLGTP